MKSSNQGKETTVRLRFRGDLGHVPSALKRIMSVVRDSGCVLGQEIEVELALAEALNNAVVHGNRMDPDKWVEVRCSCDRDNGVSIVVRDEGGGFDVNRFADVTALQSVPSVRAAGILIMQSFMDEVSFEKGGTEVHLHKDPAVARIGAIRPRLAAAPPPSVGASPAGGAVGEALPQSMA